jgi:hypothetical protein
MERAGKRKRISSSKQNGAKGIRYRNTTRMSGETPSNAIIYRGPIDTPAYRQSCDMHTFVLCFNGTLSSSAGGVLAPVFDAYAQATSSPSWSGLAALFKEFRILAFKMKYLPWNQYTKVSITTTPVYVVTDRSSVSALTSLSDATSSASCVVRSLENSFSQTIKMNGIDEAGWTGTPTAPPNASRMFIKWYASALTNSTTYGEYLSYIVVQFREI